jgi:hypothetical protein
MRAKVEEGANAGAVVRANRAIFWKEQGAFIQQVERWTAPRLAGLNAHLLDVEAKLMATGADLTETVLEEELVRIARAAVRGR